MSARARRTEDIAQQNRADGVASLVTASAAALTLKRRDLQATGIAASMGLDEMLGKHTSSSLLTGVADQKLQHRAML
jgi:alkylhydroperoxidase/carboxymuconolactone decarboxylase family protein YurZ